MARRAMDMELTNGNFNKKVNKLLCGRGSDGQEGHLHTCRF